MFGKGSDSLEEEVLRDVTKECYVLDSANLEEGYKK